MLNQKLGSVSFNSAGFTPVNPLLDLMLQLCTNPIQHLNNYIMRNAVKLICYCLLAPSGCIIHMMMLLVIGNIHCVTCTYSLHHLHLFIVLLALHVGERVTKGKR